MNRYAGCVPVFTFLAMFAFRYRYLYILLLATYSFLNILFTGGDSFFGKSTENHYLYVIILVMVFLIWESNRILFGVLQKSSHRLPGRVNILLLFFIVSLLHVLAISVLTAYLIPNLLDIGIAENISQLRLTLAFCFRINLFLHTINAIIYYNTRFKDTVLEAEQLKTLTAESQFEALRNQIKPHFLFNSFNVLSGLVHQDPGLASDFIQQLSRVYRYLLYHHQEDLVSMGTELDFLESYIFLLHIRYGDALKVQVDVGITYREGYLVPPATLQLLVENAVKHNKVSRKDSLSINIFEQERFLVIHNNLQRKSRTGHRSGKGLQNIRLRYQHLVKKEIVIEQTEQYFIVRLPLILQSDYESSDR